MVAASTASGSGFLFGPTASLTIHTVRPPTIAAQPSLLQLLGTDGQLETSLALDSLPRLALANTAGSEL
jgi:hypothetical protein